MKNMVKFSTVFNNFLTIGKILISIALVFISLVSIVLVTSILLGRANELVEIFNISHTFGPISFNVPVTEAYGLWHCFLSLIALLTLLTVTLMSINCLKKIILYVKQENPFADEVCNQLTKLAILSVVYFFIITMTELVGSLYSYNVLKSTFAQIDEIKNVDVYQGISISRLVVSAFLFFISFIFRYGSSLQKEVDETL